MPQFDFGHFYKFIVSAGLVLVATALVVPWIVFQSTGILTIPKSELDGLTDTAKTMIVERQSGLSDFQDWAFPGLPLALGTVGFGVIVLGLMSWHKRQTQQNAIDDLDLETKRAAFADATQLEVDSKLRDEVTEELRAEAATTPAVEPVPDDPASDGEREPSIQTPPGEPGLSRPGADSDPSGVTSLMHRMRDWEVSLFERLELAYTGATEPRRNVRMTTGDGRVYILDALLSPDGESEWGQLAIELKAVSTAQLVVPRIRDAMTRIGAVAVNLKPGLVYTGLPGRPPRTTTTAVVMLICQDFEAGQRLRSSAEATVRELNSIMQVRVGVIVISAESFENADATTLRRLITRAWSSRGDEGQLVWHP
ncbi:hypothetical protein [Microbacterium sp. H1-D42]|uniref:hypothetical protein n=1 Tax=Microbacterium sp. H1-D42 TaxID=2925844 RepID=UPI001F53D9D5|nr:hypothetical protein [Microbacterium sp. H1-D42]UNK70685.1 hypothetical protein MNR00_16255 [Microbacterium sp. H1-D42]